MAVPGKSKTEVKQKKMCITYVQF